MQEDLFLISFDPHHGGALTQIELLEHLNTRVHVAQVQCVLETRLKIAPMLGNFSHSTKLSFISCGQVKKRQFFELAKLLICHLHGLMISMCQCLSPESSPQFRSIKLLRHLKCNLKITTFYSKLESRLWVLNKLQRNFRVALLLKIGDNALTD